MAKITDVILRKLLEKRAKKPSGGGGVETIDKIVGRFQSLIKGLDKGVKECQKTLNENQKIIESVQANNVLIQQSIEQASVFSSNLSEMLNKKKEESSDSEKKTKEAESSKN